MSSSVQHRCVVKKNGSVWCWGYNAGGQVGDGTTDDRLLPVAVPGLASGVAAVATGAFHSCALKLDGSVWCWGYGENGTLGNGQFSSSFVPVRVTLSLAASNISSGGLHTCARTSDGRVACWGNNTAAQLADGTVATAGAPVVAGQVGLGSLSLTAGGNSTWFVAADGAVWCVGALCGAQAVRTAGCGDGICDFEELDKGSCAADCTVSHTDGICDPFLESNATYPADCPALCGNGVCEGGESCSSCATDCGACCTPTTCAALAPICGSVNNGCGGTLSCGSCTTTDSETANNSYGGAMTLVKATVYSPKLGSSGDADWSKLSLPAGSTVTVALRPPSDKNYNFQIRTGSTGTTIKATAAAGAAGATEQATYKNTGTASQTVFVRVYGATNTQWSASASYYLRASW
ncbi:MAG: hypothetical protein IPG96_11755 [Proteobacteria bacterium]|nr:hypothetical protein [Pseudomonadota bacterium]